MSLSTNLFKRFSALLPTQPLLVARVLTNNHDGTYNVTLSGGGVIRVRGEDFTADQPVYVKDGLIQGVAPDLPVVNIEI